MLIYELTDAITTLPGIAAGRARRFERIGVSSVADLLLLVPNDYEDRSVIRSIVGATQHGEGLVHARVVRHDYFPHRGKRVLKIVIADDSSSASLVCFGRNVLAKTFPVGSTILVYGSFTLRYGEIQSASFDAQHVSDPVEPTGFLPVYPLTEGLSQRIVRAAVFTAVERYVTKLDDPLPERIRAAERLVPIGTALRNLHRPSRRDEAAEALHRLRFEELFLFQLDLTRRAMHRRRKMHRFRPPASRRLKDAVISALPFSQTDDQQRVLREILGDMDNPWPMSRLLHGDVGSGKTLVALIAALHAIERGEQVALMVPTELLARQHAWNAARILKPADVRLALAIGSTAEASKRSFAAALSAGEIDLVIGTHALFSEQLTYANLGLVIIDEQHRFGVDQRAAITAHGESPDLLLMSATPIPRSLALTAFGDSEVSAITTMPPGRKAVRTRLARIGNDDRVYDFVRRELEAGHQAYFVYPAIEDGSRRGLRSATAMAEALETRFAPYTVGLAHSRLDGETRAETMRRFADGDIDVLVATSVVEVGVDVPNATCIVVEHAELFGLAALHQLRGRVGRGSDQAYCILVYQEPLTDDAKERLRVLYTSNDGFRIAEEDLRIRGPGDLLGTRQAGFVSFRIADIRRDMDLMIRGREGIAAILAEDPEMENPENALLRIAGERSREEQRCE